MTNPVPINASSTFAKVFSPKNHKELCEKLTLSQARLYMNVIDGGSMISMNRVIHEFENYVDFSACKKEIPRYFLVDLIHHAWGVLDEHLKIHHLDKEVRKDLLYRLHIAEIASYEQLRSLKHTRKTLDARGFQFHQLRDVVDGCIEHNFSLARLYFSYKELARKNRLPFNLKGKITKGP